jgi:hypothetical protein
MLYTNIRNTYFNSPSGSDFLRKREGKGGDLRRPLLQES